jgi:drug/metabolite transporter (DMT)-like permease
LSAKSWINFVLLGLIWGSSFLWIKLAVREVGPFTLVAFRASFALLGLIVAVLLRRSLRITPHFLAVFLFLGLFNAAIPFVLISWSELSISSGLASILNSTAPLFTILIAPIFLKDDRFSLPKLVGLLVGFSGVVVLVSEQLSDGLASLLGVGAMLLAAVSYAASSVFARRNTQGLEPEAQAFGQFLMATIFILPTAAVVEAPFTFPHLPLTWVSLAWLGLLGSCVATILYYSLLHSIGPTRTMLVTFVFPLVGVLLGVLVLGEPFTWRLALGAMMIISGIIVVNSNPVILNRLFRRSASDV